MKWRATAFACSASRPFPGGSPHAVQQNIVIIFVFLQKLVRVCDNNQIPTGGNSLKVLHAFVKSIPIPTEVIGEV